NGRGGRGDGQAHRCSQINGDSVTRNSGAGESRWFESCPCWISAFAGMTKKRNSMQPFTKVTGVAAPLELANIDTDKIIPARFLRRLREPGYEKLAFHDIRYDADGKDRPDFVLNQAPYRHAKILVAGANFGCGSSREAAVYVLWDYGIRSVIAPSFGDIHYGNELQNGMLPVVLPDAD